MTTPLTLYLSTTDATTLSTANILIANSTGSGFASPQTTIGKATGYGELISGSNSSPWPALGGTGTPSGHGFLWDVVTLEGQQFPAGTWTPTIRLRTTVGNITTDIHVRAFDYNGDQATYTQIGSDMLLAAQLVNSTGSNYTFGGSSLPLWNFNDAEKVYLDVWLAILTNNTGSNSAAVHFAMAQSSTQGNVACQVVTPGYQVNSGASGIDVKNSFVESLVVSDILPGSAYL